MTWVLANAELIAGRAWSHLGLAVPAIALSFLIALPIGRLAQSGSQRFRWPRATLLATTGLLYAIPSLPLFVLLPSLIATPVRSRLNVIAVLTIYGLALMVRSVADALGSVDANATAAATALGYDRWRRFWLVEFPLAGPVLLAGLRVVAVSTISLVTVSAVLGVPSLGLLFVDGFQRGIVAEVVAGIAATGLLALAVDGLLVLAGRAAMPWTRASHRRAAARSEVTA